MLRVTPALLLDEREIEFTFVRAEGPGGQNINKVATVAQLRFDVRRSTSLPESVKARLERLAGRRLTRAGVLVIRAGRHRTQEQNRAEALRRFLALLRQAAQEPRLRRPTSPSVEARARRLAGKKHRSAVKRRRRERRFDEECC